MRITIAGAGRRRRANLLTVRVSGVQSSGERGAPRAGLRLHQRQHQLAGLRGAVRAGQRLRARWRRGLVRCGRRAGGFALPPASRSIRASNRLFCCIIKRDEASAWHPVPRQV